MNVIAQEHRIILATEIAEERIGGVESFDETEQFEVAQRGDEATQKRARGDGVIVIGLCIALRGRFVEQFEFDAVWRFIVKLTQVFGMLPQAG